MQNIVGSYDVFDFEIGPANSHCIFCGAKYKNDPYELERNVYSYECGFQYEVEYKTKIRTTNALYYPYETKMQVTRVCDYEYLVTYIGRA